jgi:hypothetical protein
VVVSVSAFLAAFVGVVVAVVAVIDLVIRLEQREVRWVCCFEVLGFEIGGKRG